MMYNFFGGGECLMLCDTSIQKRFMFERFVTGGGYKNFVLCMTSFMNDSKICVIKNIELLKVLDFSSRIYTVHLHLLLDVSEIMSQLQAQILTTRAISF